MKTCTSEEIQVLSSEFRGIARRLSRTDYSQCDANLKRFMNALNQNSLIFDFIQNNNVHTFDIEGILKKRNWVDPFEISPVMAEEISFAYQMLSYAIEYFDGNFTQLYGVHHYTSAKSTINDEMRKFLDHLVDPLIDYINDYLRLQYEQAQKAEGTTHPSVPNFTAHNSTVFIGSSVTGNVSNQVQIDNSKKQDAIELIAAIKECVDTENFINKDDIANIITQIESDVSSDKKPQKGMMTALKVLCSTMKTAIPLVTALIELFA